MAKVIVDEAATEPLPLQAGEAVVHRGISVTPLFPAADPVCAYVSMAQASAQGFTVKEVDDAGDVGEIVVVNPTADRVLLYDGEEIAGAKQDRIINVAVLVEAGATVPVPVSCIEVGRWRYESDEFRPAGRTPAPRCAAPRPCTCTRRRCCAGRRRMPCGTPWRSRRSSTGSGRERPSTAT